MNARTFFLSLILCLSAFSLYAAKVDTVSTYSTCMNKNIKAVVVTPDSYKPSTRKYPVIYLLHGYGGNYARWININESFLKETADKQQVLIVCPDGGYGSWYLDSPVDPSWKYETYIINEFIPWIDKEYATIPSRTARGITGLSMGGHGALYLAFRNQEVFGVAGSTSGGIDIRPWPHKWDISNRLGEYAKYPENWEQHTVINMTHLLIPDYLKIIIDCGTEDFFHQINSQLHQKLLDRNIPHDYIARPGKHNSAYWKNAIQYQVLFMLNYFEEAGTLPKK